MSLPLFLLVQAAVGEESLMKAAARHVPGVEWCQRSVVVADFTCAGRKQQAILGITSTDIVIAIFVNGIRARPEVLRYSSKIRGSADATLTTEGLDYDPKVDPGYELPGFKRSKSCKGLNLSDGRSDSAHIYWNHESRQFDDWVR